MRERRGFGEAGGGGEHNDLLLICGDPGSGKSELAKLVARVRLREISLLLGRKVLAGETIGPMEAVRAIGYFVGAKQWQHVGAVMLMALGAFVSQKTVEDDWMFATMWPGRLPDAMRADIRIAIRSYQASVLVKMRRYSGQYIEELEELLGAREGDGQVGRATVLGIAVPAISSSHPHAALRLAAKVLRPDADGLLESTWAVDSGLEQALWLLAMRASGASDADACVALLQGLDQPTLERLCRAPIALRAAMALSDALWKFMPRAASRKAWTARLACIRRHTEWAQAVESGLLVAAFTRAEVVILSERLEDLPNAVETGRRRLEAGFLDDRAKFAIRYILGAQFAYRHDWGGAGEWLAPAVLMADHALPEQHVYTLLYAAASVPPEAHGERVELCSRAAAIASGNSEVGEMLRCKAWGELGLAVWERDGVAAAVSPWNRAFESLWKARTNSKYWRALCMRFGHCMGYLSSLAQFGRAPSAAEGEQPYQKPHLGMLAVTEARLAKFYDPSREAPLWVQMAALLAHASDWTRWRTLVQSGFGVSLRTNMQPAIAVLGPDEVVTRPRTATAVARHPRRLARAREQRCRHSVRCRTDERWMPGRIEEQGRIGSGEGRPPGRTGA